MNNYNNKYLVIFSTVKFVFGSKYCVICDLQRQEYFSINKEFAEKILSYNKSSLKQIFDEKCISFEDIEVLKVNEILFYTSFPDRFPDLNLEVIENRPITHCILDLKEINLNLFKNFWADLENIGCEFLQVRFFNRDKLSNIGLFLSGTQNSRILSIELIMDVLAP